jgi:hypothetical protein
MTLYNILFGKSSFTYTSSLLKEQTPFAIGSIELVNMHTNDHYAHKNTTIQQNLPFYNHISMSMKIQAI